MMTKKPNSKYRVTKGRILEEKEIVQEKEFPHLVIRYMAGVYNRVRIVFVGSDKQKPVPDTLTLVEPNPLDSQGRLTEKCKSGLIMVVQQEAKRSGFRICVVFGKQECVYCEPDGTAKESTEPPEGGVTCLRFPLEGESQVPGGVAF